MALNPILFDRFLVAGLFVNRITAFIVVVNLAGFTCPANAIEALVRQLLPEIRSYFESEEGKAAFEEWKARQTSAGGLNTKLIFEFSEWVWEGCSQQAN